MLLEDLDGPDQGQALDATAFEDEVGIECRGAVQRERHVLRTGLTGAVFHAPRAFAR
jgi:hypothetical protein